MKKKLLAASLLIMAMLGLNGCGESDDDVIVLRVSNWEEYIDLGDWDEDEAIELSDDTVIFGKTDLVTEFEEWFYETYGKEVRVEYSTFGTNEELYNQLTIGDVYDLVCPSEYMIMKMMREDMLVPYSDEFFDESVEENYYVNCVSPYIRNIYDNLSIEGSPISEYATGYMWGTLGIVYNPEVVSEEDASHWDILINPDYYRQVTIKDSVRDAYVAAMGIAYYDTINTDDFKALDNYNQELTEVMNRTDEVTVDRAEAVLTQCKNNVYSFETDAGKADMVSGKVVANEQWSGDGVYTIDQAEEDDLELCYSVPEEGSNLWFDGWVMLKKGIEEDPDKQLAAEAFVNFLSRPDNAIRNMYYIGYTSVISGGESDLILDYANYLYAAEDDEEDTVEYSIGYFFDYGNEDADEEYTIITTEDQTRRQLFAQYPIWDVVNRCTVMACFDDEDNERINRMWTNVRCFDLKSLFGE